MPRFGTIIFWQGAILVVAVLLWQDEWLQPRIYGFADRASTGEPNPQVGALFDALRTVGKWPAIALAIVVLFRLHSRGRFWAAAAAVSVIAALGVNELAWRTVSRVRPSHPVHRGNTVFLEPFRGFGGDREGASFPSSEAMVAMSLATVLAAAAPELAVLWYGIAAASGFLRIEAGAHYPSDVFAGALLGFAVARGCMGLLRRFVPQ